MIKYIVWILFLYLLIFQPTYASAHGQLSNELVYDLLSTVKNPRNSEDDFIALENGKILFAYTWFLSLSSDHSPAQIMGGFSEDDGKTCSDEDNLIVDGEGDQNVMSVSLLRLQNGDIALFYARKNSITDCIPMMRISEDEGLTWSDPIKCITDRPGYFVLNNSRVIQLEDGRLLIPVALHESEEVKDGDLEIQFNNYGKLFCYYSDDNGLTWKRKSMVEVAQGIMAQEPGLIEMKDGRIMMYIRTNSGVQYVSYSKSKGRKWSAAIPTNIPSPLSPATIVRIPSTQDLLLVWNNNGVKKDSYRGKRTPFNLAISKDEGVTWDNVKTLHDDPDGWYCYTAVHFINDQEFLLSYCAGDRPAGTGLSITNISKIPIDWLYE